MDMQALRTYPIGWIREKAEELAKKGITSEKMILLSTMEEMAYLGGFRVLYCLYKAPMRFTELEKITGIPKSNLNKLLKTFKLLGLIDTIKEKEEIPRRESVEKYTKLKSKLSDFAIFGDNIVYSFEGWFAYKKSIEEVAKRVEDIGGWKKIRR